MYIRFKPKICTYIYIFFINHTPTCLWGSYPTLLYPHQMSSGTYPYIYLIKLKLIYKKTNMRITTINKAGFPLLEKKKKPSTSMTTKKSM